METIENGVQLPEATDSPATVLNILRANFKKYAAHNHSGANSNRLHSEDLPPQAVAPARTVKFDVAASSFAPLPGSPGKLFSDLTLATIGENAVDLDNAVPFFFKNDGDTLVPISVDFQIRTGNVMRIISNVAIGLHVRFK